MAAEPPAGWLTKQGKFRTAWRRRWFAWDASGDRLRLQEYSDKFLSDASAAQVAEMLAESQPPVHVSVLILRQWYTKYHPDSGVFEFLKLMQICWTFFKWLNNS